MQALHQLLLRMQQLLVAAQTQIRIQRVKLLTCPVCSLLLAGHHRVGNGCGWVVLKEIVDIILILLIDPVLLQSLSLLLYVIDSFVEWFLGTHFRQTGRLTVP